LSRIGQDLAWLVSSMPEFRVGYLGRGAIGKARFPWAQYSYPPAGQWGEDYIEACWSDLAGDRKGIIFTCWDASRLLWFSDPNGIPQESFLRSGRFERWGYFMCDGAGVAPSQLPLEQAHVISQYRRAILASHWAYDLATGIQGPQLDWLPHPINRDVFRPLDKTPIRSVWNIGKAILIGCVMTNQARKHWPTVMEAVSLLSQGNIKPRLWVHTDLMLHYWDINALAVEYGIADQIIYEGRALSDQELAYRYSACDVTVVISGGEGFCYPVAESLSCGVPAVTGSYGAQAELTHWTVRPVTTVIDTSHNVRRAVYRGSDVAAGIAEALEQGDKKDECVELAAHLNMKQLGVAWKKWFREGLANA
jgi:glycosyltransferase involved in cell wall biosynthesis